MNQITEMLKGVLEGCVLEIIGQGETYGYEITQKLRELGFEDVVEGTVYTRKKPSKLGPARKWYRLNEAGQIERGNFWKKWAFISEKLEFLRHQNLLSEQKGENHGGA